MLNMTSSINISKFSTEQKDVFTKVVQDKRSIFFTGCAGTGKSLILQKVIEALRKKLVNLNLVAVTASTGIAAQNIGGCTLHSFAGIGLAKGEARELSQTARFNKNAYKRWRAVQVLIIDEISMIDGDLFDKLEYIARDLRASEKPFGGIQLVLVGDLLQLPPVEASNEIKKRVIEADSWNRCVEDYILLTTIFRQEDMKFVRFLSCLRIGAITREVKNFGAELEKKKDFGDDSEPVELFATRNKVEQFNNSRLDTLSTELQVYKSIDKSTKSNFRLLDSCQAVRELRLKIGAQVMLIKNLSRDLVNGTVGTVISFAPNSSKESNGGKENANVELVPMVRFTLISGKTFTRPMKRENWDSTSSTGMILASRKQIPVILAWAITIHKSQGQTIQRLRVDVSNVFESGQLYTALSRAVSPDYLEVSGLDLTRIKVDTTCLAFCINNNLI